MKHHITLWVALLILPILMLHTTNGDSPVNILEENSQRRDFNRLYGYPKSALLHADPELPGLYVEIAHLLAAEARC